MEMSQEFQCPTYGFLVLRLEVLEHVIPEKDACIVNIEVFKFVCYDEHLQIQPKRVQTIL